MTSREELNAKLKRTDIKGREYVEVDQRIMAFWELYPNGRIETKILGDNGERCTFMASAYDGDTLLATGHAFEDRQGYINKTSYLENCETSAVGRCLGILGIGVIGGVATAEEVTNAIAQQPIQGCCTACGLVYNFESKDQMDSFTCQCGCDKFTEVENA